MPDVFSTEILSIHHNILIALKDQFDLHKLLQIIVKIRSVPCVSYFYCFLVKADQIVILTINDEE